MSSAVDFSRLPAPAVVETLDYEAILASLKADLAARLPELAPVLALESEPLVKLLEVAAWRELVLRQRVNDAARSQLLAFADGGDLDHLAAFYGVARLAGEADAALRQRVQARISGWANAGGAAHYRYWALSASVDVQDVGVVSPMPGVVQVCVLAREGADEGAVLAAVEAVVSRDDVRVLTDTVEVISAQMVEVAIDAELVLLPGAPAALDAQLQAELPAYIRQHARLGWDLTRSWLIRELHGPFVHHVRLLSPADEVRCAPHQAVRITQCRVRAVGVEE